MYSLGIMLYRIVYGKFPFISESTVEIYKEQIENEFEFPGSNYSPHLIEVVKKLLAKSPIVRYENSLQILNDLGIELTSGVVKDFIPASVFANRQDVISQTDSYLNDTGSRDALVIFGVEGSGKTSFIYTIYSNYDTVIRISGGSRRKGINFIQYLLKKIIFSEFVYPYLKESIIVLINKILSNESDNLISDMKSILTGISLDTKFVIIIDDFSLLDEFALDVCREILPILQVNGIKIILTVRPDNQSSISQIINRIQEINLSPFTGENLNEYLDKAFVTFFPKDQLKGLVIRNSDLLPGSIINFVRDLILLNVIKFYPDGPEIVSDENTDKLLESSYEEIYTLRLSLLTPDETKIAQFLSSFDVLPEINVITEINNLSIGEFSGIAKKLEENNILDEDFFMTSEKTW
ncbi:MAG: hypothetical protein P8X91_10855 [Candidatus Bathyarchaeota archaeon]